MEQRNVPQPWGVFVQLQKRVRVRILNVCLQARVLCFVVEPVYAPNKPTDKSETGSSSSSPAPLPRGGELFPYAKSKSSTPNLLYLISCILYMGGTSNCLFVSSPYSRMLSAMAASAGFLEFLPRPCWLRNFGAGTAPPSVVPLDFSTKFRGWRLWKGA